MSDTGNDPERRREALEEGLEKAKEGAQKAKEGAQKLTGWLGQRLGAAMEQIKSSEPVREKLDELERHQAERARDRRTDALAGIYDDWAVKLHDIITALDSDREGLGKSIEAINYNINELRLRNVAEDHEEMREYQSQVAALREESRELEAAREPFQDEIERLVRQCRAAIARLDAAPEQITALQSEARQQVAASQARLESLPERLAQDRGAGGEAGKE